MLIQEVGACLFPFLFSSSVISLVLIFFHSFLFPFHISSFFSFLSFVPFSQLFHCVILFSVFRNLSIFISSSHFSFIPPFIYYIRPPPSFLSGLGVISLLHCYKPTARTKTRFAKRSSARHLSPIYRQFIIQWHLLGGA